MISLAAIQAYYDQSHAHYVQHWQLNRYQAMHYGLWWADTHSFGEALLNTQRFLATKARVSARDRVLDAGCGVGGSALWLAEQHGCEVVGITLSDKQVQRARRLSHERGLEALVSFDRQDYSQTAFPAESFDLVWTIESACHALDRAALVAEVYRLLRPGGRWVSCDFVRHPDARLPLPQAYHQWLRGWAMPPLATAAEWQALMVASGFHPQAGQDLTEAIHPSARRLYHRFLLGFPVQKLYEWLGNPSEVQRRSVRTALWQWQALRAGTWRYACWAGEKPKK